MFEVFEIMAENYNVPNIEGVETLPKYVRDRFYENPGAQDEHGNTVIHKHVSSDEYFHKFTESLISKETDLEIKNKDGKTAFLLALVRCHKFMIEALIGEGASVHTSDNDKCNALHYIAGIAVNDIDGWMDKPWARHPLSCLLPFFESFLQKGIELNLVNKFGDTPLMWAAKGHNVKIVKLLLKYGANVHVKNEFMRTCLHRATTPSETNEKLWNESNSDIITEMIRNGACVNCFDDEGKTPLGCILNAESRNKDYFARRFLKAACLANSQRRGDFYIYHNRVLGESKKDSSLKRYVVACYKEIGAMSSFELAERFNVCHFALRGVPEHLEGNASRIRDDVLEILVDGTFPIYHDFIFSNFQESYLRPKWMGLDIFMRSQGQNISLNPDVNILLALFLDVKELFNVYKVFTLEANVGRN